MEEYRKKCCLALLLDEHQELSGIENHAANCPYPTILWRSGPNSEQLPFLPEGPHPEVLNSIFEDGFSKGFRKVIIMKSDSFPDLTLLDEAFLSLRLIECCIGLKEDGDFYLLGMNDYRPEILAFIPPDGSVVSKKIIRRMGDQKLALYKTATMKSE